uniref:tripartite motif-containing protein 16-like n=1 Tax=Solea senegalensis TaxID=28829 RepID=UPI001CD8809C|nr:tripartite motif-containing protein 16-like [Solea senegalensis]
MDENVDQLEWETFSCPMCLDLLKDPVAIFCGHSYCMNCIQSHWDTESGIYSCLQCTQTVLGRPRLMKNILLADLVEQLRKSAVQAAPADHCYAGAEDVSCDVCTGRKLKAAMSCLNCLASYCEKHLQPHYESPPFKKHKLVDPCKKLQENICPQHNKMMDMFCFTDHQHVCYLCSVDKHKGHDTVTAAAGRMQKQKELDLSLEEIQQRLQDRKKDVEMIEQKGKDVNLSVFRALEDNENIFTELIQLLKKTRSGVMQRLRSQHEPEERRFKDLQEKLQQEITELKRKVTELKQLSLIQDHNQFLLNYCSLSAALGPSTHSSSINIAPARFCEDVTAALSQVRGQVQDVLTRTWTHIGLTLNQDDVLLPQPEPRTRVEFLQYSREITMDPNTLNTWIILSEGNRKVTLMNHRQSYSTHPDRFTDWYQVLSRESLTGQCYWEVEYRGLGVYVAVTYKTFRRAGKSVKGVFGFNDKSWALCLGSRCYYLLHSSISTKVSDGLSSRLGVYLDHSAGLLSFYSVSNTMTLLHRVQTTFTQPLYVGVGFKHYLPGATAEFCDV